MTKNLPRQSLGFFPTPLGELRNLGKALNGPRLLIKRDDQTGLAMGGNKTRKLEYLIGDAIAKGADTIITAGAAQSNHCRQTAAACAASGLECHLALGGAAPPDANGNLLLDMLLNAHIHWSGEARKGERTPQILELLKSQGKKPYIIPYGGSNEIGAIGFVEAVRELDQQTTSANIEISHIVFASSSGGTQAGLLTGKVIYRKEFEVIGINIDKDESGDIPFRDYVHKLSSSTIEKMQVDYHFTENEIILRDEFVGKGYGVVGEFEREAIALLAQHEGILVDPVYTGRAMGGLIQMIRNKELTSQDTVLFWHTGGAPALFSYAKEMLDSGNRPD